MFELDLSRTDLKKLPESLLKCQNAMKQLRTLNLSFNKISEICPQISSFEKVETLDLSNNRLITLPKTLTQMTSLKRLLLSKNKLINLPLDIGNLTKLVLLDVSKNSIEILPNSIGSLTALENLDISANKLTTIPSSIVNLTKLKFCMCEQNMLREELKEASKSINTLFLYFQGGKQSTPESFGITKTKSSGSASSELDQEHRTGFKSSSFDYPKRTDTSSPTLTSEFSRLNSSDSFSSSESIVLSSALSQFAVKAGIAPHEDFGVKYEKDLWLKEKHELLEKLERETKKTNVLQQRVESLEQNLKQTEASISSLQTELGQVRTNQANINEKKAISTPSQNNVSAAQEFNPKQQGEIHDILKKLDLQNSFHVKHTISGNEFDLKNGVPLLQEIVAKEEICAKHPVLKHRSWIIKRVPLSVVNEALRKKQLREGIIGRSVMHPNLLNIISIQEIDSSTILYLMDKMSFSLEDAIFGNEPESNAIQAIKWKVFPVSAKVYLLLEIARGIQYLHQQKEPIIHRDLKPANILLKENGLVKICDFGISTKYKESKKMTQSGTDHYISPEIALNKKTALTSDIYSFGQLIYAIIVGSQPLGLNIRVSKSDLSLTIYNSIVEDVEKKNSQMSQSGAADIISSCNVPELAQLFKLCVQYDKEDRPSIHEVVESLQKTRKQVGDFDVQCFADLNTAQLSGQELLKIRKLFDEKDLMIKQLRQQLSASQK